MATRSLAYPLILSALVFGALGAGALDATVAPPARSELPPAGPTAPHVLLVTVDTLRADRLGAYGYERNVSPNLDRLIEAGVRFANARTVEPLTSPSLCSLLTSRSPDLHGSTRNGLRMRPGLSSLPKAFQANGYRTGAFAGNWTLRDKLTGLAEHFDDYEEVLTRRRWFGMIRGEATADDLTEQAGKWLRQHLRTEGQRPFFLWVHYVEPHAPYRLQKDYLEQLGLSKSDNLTASDRYDTEIAFVDHAIGRLFSRLAELGLEERTIVVFASDHGESLGEHGYWGHGRHLYEPTLHVPMSISWPGRLEAATVEAPALITDLAPTLLGLLGHGMPADFEGYDWTSVLAGGEAPWDRVTHYQAHRGAVISHHDSDMARQAGLLAVGRISGHQKEIFRVGRNRHLAFDLAGDPEELESSSAPRDEPSEGLMTWLRTIYEHLGAFDDAPPEPLDQESIEQLKSLGYVGD